MGTGRNASACCKKEPARAIRRGGWATILLFRQLAEANLETLAAGGREEASFPSARIACERFSRTGASTARRRRSNITANFWRGMPDKLPRQRNGRRTVVFHDPCYLGRYRGIYDEPREVIAAVCDV